MDEMYARLLSSGIDPSPVGFTIGEGARYFCTPADASILGWAGVDGIHFIQIPAFGDTVFAVSPMNGYPDFVHPVAADFADFLRLLAACFDTAAIEQAWQWDRDTFYSFLGENAPDEEQIETIGALCEKLGIEPMDEPYEYITSIQNGFDYDAIEYTPEFFDALPEQALEEEWPVYFEGNRERGEPGAELPLNKSFTWAGHDWLMPSAYVCHEGLVLDILYRTPSEDMVEFAIKHHLWPEPPEESLTPEQREAIEAEHPMNLDFRPSVTVNGCEIRDFSGSSRVYTPCFPDYEPDRDARRFVERYGLDQDACWTCWRYSFPWPEGAEVQEIRSLEVHLEAAPVRVPGPVFSADAGEDVAFTNPVTGAEHTLHVEESETEELPESGLQEFSQFPRWCRTLEYSISPDIPVECISIRDAHPGDPVRPKYSPADGPVSQDAACIGVIGGSDGPTSVIVGAPARDGLRAAVSSLYFAPPDLVEWRMCFYDKRHDDICIRLI